MTAAGDVELEQRDDGFGRRTHGRPAAERALAIAIALAALFLFLNGSFFSTLSALHVDFSINWTAAHALLDGEVPYGRTTLAERAAALDGPTNLLYSQTFTSYIQPPTSALVIAPLTALGWRDASRVYLLLNHVALAGAIALSLVTVRPTLPAHWTVALLALILLAFHIFFASFTLGQVDASLLFLLALGFYGFQRRRPALAGLPIAIAAAIKLVPGIVVLYFIVRGDFRAAAWAVGAGAVILVASLPAAGLDAYETYLRDTLPSLTRGSSHYSNVSLTGAIARESSPDVVGSNPRIISLDELPLGGTARALMAMTALGVVGAAAAVVGPRRRRQAETAEPAATNVFGYYLFVAAGLLVSSVTWQFYAIWLLPVFLAAYLAPRRVLPASQGVRALVLGALAVAAVVLSYPPDCELLPSCYLFEPNGVFYHPDWVPAVWLEQRLHLYEGNLSAAPYVQLAALGVIAAVVAGLVLWRRAADEGRDPPGEATPEARHA